jgi:hypothetical protein
MGDSPTTSLDDKVDFGDIPAGTGITGRRGKKKVYKRYTNADVVIEALIFYNRPLGSSLTASCKEDGRRVPLSTMKRLFKDCNVFQLQAQKTCVTVVEKVLKSHLAKTRANARKRTGSASQASRYLTNNEELAIVQMARLMGACGAGISRDELLDIVNTYIHHHADPRMIEKASMGLVDQILKRHSVLAKLVSASSMDPQRAKQATTETRDAVFFKLDGYIKTLNVMGHCEWKSFADVPDGDKLNMDEVGADTTKHRKKVIADKIADWARVFQVTPEGDGKMNMHVTICVTTCGNGMFADKENNVLGACAPVIIHCDRTKTKEKEDEERRRQRAGERPNERFVSPRYSAGISLPGIKVLTTRNGSMTQETFEVYAHHLVDSMPANHGPKILFLDGHGSRWNRQTLLYLIKNKIFPFFFASHTSIWAQPNDGGTNLRLHNCIEEAVRNRRRTGGTPNVAYFNSIICDAWKLFVERERQDLRAQTTNTTRNSYVKAGIGDFTPFCEGWRTALETTGRVLNNKEKSAIQYEPVARANARTLTLAEKLVLRDGIDYIDTESDLGDLPFAILRAQEILAKWRDEVRTSVDEGEEVVDITEANQPLPSNAAQHLALEIVDLVVVDVDAIELPAEKSREQKALEITIDIVKTSFVADCIKVTYLSNSEESEESESGEPTPEMKMQEGRAIKTSLADDPDQNSWNVTVRGENGGGTTFTVTERVLLGGSFIVERAYNDMTAEQKKKVLAKNKRMRKKEARAQETKLAGIARNRRKELEREEYKNIIEIFASGRTYEFPEFEMMLAKMRKPFSCNIDGRDVTVTESDAAIMMEKSALNEISEILVSTKKRNNDADDNNTTRKRRRNNAACNTTRGATGFDALHGAARRDHRDNAATLAKDIRTRVREKEQLQKTLTQVDKHKEDSAAAEISAREKMRAAKQRRARTQGGDATQPRMSGAEGMGEGEGTTRSQQVDSNNSDLNRCSSESTEDGRREAQEPTKELTVSREGGVTHQEADSNDSDLNRSLSKTPDNDDGESIQAQGAKGGNPVSREEMTRQEQTKELTVSREQQADSNDSDLNRSLSRTPDSDDGESIEARGAKRGTPVSREEMTRQRRLVREGNNTREQTDSTTTNRMLTVTNLPVVTTDDDEMEPNEAAKTRTVSQEAVTQRRRYLQDERTERERCANATTNQMSEGASDMADDARLCEDLRKKKENEEEEVPVAEYWHVHEKSLSTTMELFLRLFLPKSGITNKNKGVKWITLNEKVIKEGLLTKPQFDSRVEDLVRRLRTIEMEIKDLVPDKADETDGVEIDETS